MTSIIELAISGTDVPGAYKVQVIESPGGDAAGTFQLEALELLDGLGDFQQTLLASSVPSRRLLSRGETSVRVVGRRLFDALFAQKALAGVYRASCAVAADRGETLRMVLRVNVPELAALPWESMFDETAGSYLCRREPLVRYLPVAASTPPLNVSLPLRILALVASPRGLAALDVEKEKEDLENALAMPIERGSIVLHWLEHTTWASLQDALLSESWHVVHFIGHGDFDLERDEGVLALENPAGRVHRVNAESFVDLLREAQPMPRLVVLNACESSTAGSTDMFSGTAAALVRGGVSAVTAMQFAISDQAAIAFCRGFYAAVGRGRGIDEAVRSGRVAILGLGDESLEWITPTLYLRGRETHLFALAGSTSVVGPGPTREEARHQAEAAVERGDVASAVPLYDAVLAEEPDDLEAREARQQALADAQPTVDSTTSAPRLETAGTAYPDRSAEIWRMAKLAGFLNRPNKGETTPLATMLSPDEKIIGCRRLALALTEGAAVLVTDQNLYFSSSAPVQPPGLEFYARIPTPFRSAEGCARIPLSEIAGPLEVVGRTLAIPLRGHGTLLVSQWLGEDAITQIKDWVLQAREQS